MSAGALRFCDYTFSRHVTTSNCFHARRVISFLSYLKQGHAIVEQDGREADVNAGDIVLFDPMRPLRIEAEMQVRSFDMAPSE